MQLLLSLAIGFAVAGLSCSTYELATDRRPSFGLLSTGARPSRLAAVPLLLLGAPFLIVRNVLFGLQEEGRRFELVFLATVIAGAWSLMSGVVVVSALQACGVLAA